MIAGIPLEKAAGSKTSVYTGSFTSDYEAIQLKDPLQQSKYVATGVARSLLANRISWFFDFTGLSVNLDSACSSSMMALDLACQGLLNGDSTMVNKRGLLSFRIEILIILFAKGIAAGCNLIYDIATSSSLSTMGFLSRDSRCFSFEDRANGYGRGEGFGVIIVKLLSDAIRDGDTIRAVLRSTGSNQDGRTPSLTQPSKAAQERLIKQTYQKAGLDIRLTKYLRLTVPVQLLGILSKPAP